MGPLMPSTQWRVQWGQLYPAGHRRTDNPTRAVQRGGCAGMWDGVAGGWCMDEHARWRAQHARRLRGAEWRQVKSGELGVEKTVGKRER